MYFIRLCTELLNYFIFDGRMQKRVVEDLKNLSIFSSPSCSSEPDENVLTWTPGCRSVYLTDSDDDDDEEDNHRSHVSITQQYNQALERLSELANVAKPPDLCIQIPHTLASASQEEKDTCIERATEACKLVCKIIAPNDPENLFQSLPREDQGKHLLPLINAFTQAPSRNLKTQILSIYAYELPVKTLQKLHEPFGRLTQWQIKRARAHAKNNGPGVTVIKPKYHRISLDMSKVDHFLDFVNRPYFHQDVAFGTRLLKLESGETIEMPNVVRTVTRSTMISQYMQFCTEEEFVPISRATLFRILEVREASQRKSLQGLDNTAADGSTSFSTMEKIAQQLTQVGVDKKWSQDVIKNLQKAKLYLKSEYKVHCQVTSSPCADHCRPFALSDPVDGDFQMKCTHKHTMTCELCENISSILEELRCKIKDHKHFSFTEDNREDLLHDFQEAYANIYKWKSHILRSVNQEKAKQEVLEKLDETMVLIVFDWAMKFTQIRFREKQSDWYGKRGMSWHVSSVVSTDIPNSNVIVTSYVHLFDSCTQEWFSVISIIENLFTTIKSRLPNVRKAFLRSDEAGCYHNNLLIASLKDVGARVGIAVERYDFSEPQQGKDICDRIICPLKSSIRRFCDEGNDVLTAKDMHTALSHHPVKGATASTNIICESVEQIKMNKIKNFSSFHNFEYVDNGIRVWKAFGIGKGKVISDKALYITHQEDTKLEVRDVFPRVGMTRQGKLMKERTTSETSEEGLFECAEPGCNHTFKTFESLELHMDLGRHSRFVNNESVYDVLKREWASNFSTITSTNTQSSKDSTSLRTGASHLSMGWALSKPRTGSLRFPDNVRKYLFKKFKFGERTGHKADPTQVALDMRSAKCESGDRLFTREDWLNKQQIKGFFSRLAKKQREGSINSGLDFEDTECESEDEEDELREEVRACIVKEINVNHPIYYDVYDLCDLHEQQKLSVFKVGMLKEICDHFELQYKSKDRKTDLIRKISNMVQNCSCNV